MNLILRCGLLLQSRLDYLLDFILDRETVLRDFSGKPFKDIYSELEKSSRADSLGGAIFNYKDSRIKDLVWQLKFNDNGWVSDFFGFCLYEKILLEFSDRENVRVILIPIPIHKKRRAERGYNQCEWLCKSIMKNYANSQKSGGRKFDDQKPGDRKFNDQKSGVTITYNPKILKRIKYTTKQSWVGQKEREENIRGVFAVNEKELITDKTSKIFILIDDVYTTGATMKEALRTFGSAALLDSNIRYLTVAN